MRLERTQFTDGAKARFIDDQTGGFLTQLSQYEGVMKAVTASYGSYEEAVIKTISGVYSKEAQNNAVFQEAKAMAEKELSAA